MFIGLCKILNFTFNHATCLQYILCDQLTHVDRELVDCRPTNSPPRCSTIVILQLINLYYSSTTAKLYVFTVNFSHLGILVLTSLHVISRTIQHSQNC